MRIVAIPAAAVAIAMTVALAKSTSAAFAQAADPGSEAAAPEGGAQLLGFVQGNYALRVSGTDCPPGMNCAVMRAEERLQLRLESSSADGRVGALARVDLIRDAVRDEASVEVRELSADLSLHRFSARLGRQVLTWGLGDLLFINDVFPKDWVAFLTGAPLEYLKLGSDALRIGLYSGSRGAEFVVIPVFEPDRVPSGTPLFFFDPMPLVTDRVTERPPLDFGNMQAAARVYRAFGRWEAALYASRGFYGMPGARPDDPQAPTRLIFFHPRLTTYGVSVQGPLLSGVLSLEGGHYDSRDDRSGSDPSVENSQTRGLAAYQLQPWGEASLSVQYYVEVMIKHDAYLASVPVGMPARDRIRQVASLRVRQLLSHQTVQLGVFVMGSPTDEDLYMNPSLRYQVTDELWGELGGNLFGGKHGSTFFGQFEKNSHVYVTVRYAF